MPSSGSSASSSARRSTRSASCPTEKIARELPELISGIVDAIAEGDGDPFNLTKEQAERAASLAALRAGAREARAADVARDVAALQTVLLHALREDLEDDPVRFAEAVEQLVEATAAIQAEAMEAHVASRSRELESQANTDPLTGLGNLRALQRQLATLLDVRKRYQHPFAVLLMDIDGLKRINDSHGHPAGDRVLMQVGMSLRRSIRSVDTAARIGGDEFCVLLPEQDLKSAAKLAARLATAIEEEVAAPGDPPSPSRSAWRPRPSTATRRRRSSTRPTARCTARRLPARASHSATRPALRT